MSLLRRGRKGDKGDKGEDGTPATVTVMATNTVSPEMPASVVNTGTPSNVALVFNVPRGVPGRITRQTRIAMVSIPTLLAGATFTGDVNLGNDYQLIQVASTVSNTRVRLYLSSAYRDADLTRVTGTPLPSNHGLIYESVLPQGVTSLEVLPVAMGCPVGNTFISVTNNSNVPSIASEIQITYLTFN